MASEYTNIGRVAPYYKGVWSSSAAYMRLDIVSSADRTTAYIARKDVPAGTALTNTAYWVMVLDLSGVLENVDSVMAEAQGVLDSKANAISAEATGNPVTVYADGGSALVPFGDTSFAIVQGGSGEPSQSNVRPLTAYTAIKLNGGAGNVSASIGESVYGGVMHWDTGEFEVGFGSMLLTGSEGSWSAGGGNFFIAASGIIQQISDLYSDQFVNAPSVSVNQLGANQMRQGGTPTNIVFGNPTGMSKDAWLARLAAKPVRVVYRLQKPYRINVNVDTLRAVEGLNVVSTNGEVLNLRYNRSLNMLLDDALTAVDEMVESGRKYLDLPAFEYGYIVPGSGQPDDAYVPTNRARTARSVYLPSGTVVRTAPGYEFRVAFYVDEAESVFEESVPASGFSAAPITLKKGRWARFSVRRSADEEIDLAAMGKNLTALLQQKDDSNRSITVVTDPDCKYALGYIAAGTGKFAEHTQGNRIAAQAFVRALEGSTVTVKDSAKMFRVAKYSAPDESAFIGSVPSAFYNYGTTVTIDEDCWIRVTLGSTDDSKFDLSAAAASLEYRLLQSFDTWAETTEQKLRGLETGDDADLLILQKPVHFEAIAPQSVYVPFDHESDGGYEKFSYFSSVEDLYDAWQELINESSGYLRKTILGKDSSGKYDIWQITAKDPDPYVSASDVAPDIKKPKIILSASLHGLEKQAAFAAYYLFRDIIRNCGKDATLYYLRYCVDWEIIPLLNPWGFDQPALNGADAYVERYNKTFNGININRAFETGFRVSDKSNYYYGGSAPVSEENKECIEALYLKRLLDANTDAVYYCDYHANPDPGPLYIYHNMVYHKEAGVNHVNPYMYGISHDSVEHLIRRYRADYDAELGWTSGSKNGQIVIDSQQGQSYAYAESIGLYGQVTEAMFRTNPANSNMSTWCNDACMRINTRSIGVWFHMLLHRLYTISMK